MAMFVAAAALIIMAQPPVAVADLFMPPDTRAGKPENGPDENA